MTLPLQESSLSYLAGASTGFATFLAQVAPETHGGWVQIAIQAGMAGVVVILLLKFFPMLLDRMERANERHEATIRHIVTENAKKDDAWQEIIQARGVCPISPPQHNNHNQSNQS